jgi:hypothetical protein
MLVNEGARTTSARPSEEEAVGKDPSAVDECRVGTGVAGTEVGRPLPISK